MTIIINILLMILGMIGGQINKAVRRFGIPSVAVIYGMVKAIKKNNRKRDKAKFIIFTLLIPILSMGYGVDSLLTKVFKKDWIVRIAYAFLLSIPIAIYMFTTSQFGFNYIYYLISLALAYSVRAGSLWKIGKYDILIEDMIRYFVLGRIIILII